MNAQRGLRYGFLSLLAGALLFPPNEAPAKEPVRISTGKILSPAGKQTGVGSFPATLILSPDGRFLVATDAGFREQVSVLSAKDGSLVSKIEANETRKDGSKKKEGLYYGLAFGPAKEGSYPLYVSRGNEDRISVYSLDSEGKLTDAGRSIADPSGVPNFDFPNCIAGLAVSRDGSRLYAVHNETGPKTDMKGSLSVIDPSSGAILSKLPMPGFPYAVAALQTDAADKVYVSSERDGVVAVADMKAGKVVKEIPTGDHPISLLLNKAGDRLFVANAGSDTVSVVDTATDSVIRTILLRPDDARGLPGATPTGLALSPDESRLCVSLGDMNAVAVVDMNEEKTLGYIPVGWYPTSVVVSPDGKRLFAANAKGVEPRNPNGKAVGPNGAWGQYIQNILEGTVSSLPFPDSDQLERYTKRVIANNRLDVLKGSDPNGGFKNPGIEHVIYIIKENRTYDQVLGDMKRGNGDPSLCFFPRAVTPNLHALSERFALLDNYYACSEVSADGWNWSTSGMANEYVERNAPYSYGGRGRSYDFEGQNNGVPVDLQGIPDVAEAPGGYLWDLCVKKGIDFRNYGFFVGPGDPHAVGMAAKSDEKVAVPNKKALEGRTDPNFRWFDLSYADSDAWVRIASPAPKQMKAFGAFDAPSRFSEWKREFDGYAKSGKLPAFMMIRLGRDHTSGTSPGESSPRAMVADNDFAVGEVVDAVSRSPFWKTTAIFALEDDAQNGFDHVDAHRSTAYVISPFVKKSIVDHRFYNTDSILRTMELLLGLPPMNQCDAIAPPLDVFGIAPDNDAAYDAILPDREILAEANTDQSYKAKTSERLPFGDADEVPDAVLNEILWGALRPGIPQPPVRYGLSLFAPDKD